MQALECLSVLAADYRRCAEEAQFIERRRGTTYCVAGPPCVLRAGLRGVPGELAI